DETSYSWRILPPTEIACMRQCLKTSWASSYVAYNSVRGCRMSGVALSFNKRVIYQESCAREVLCLRCVGGERPSVNSSLQITRSRAASCGFRDDRSDSPIGGEAASGQW